jgi:hypothetical protein
MIHHEDKFEKEDIMITIEKTINDAIKEIGVQFEELLEEKMNDMKVQLAQAIENGNKKTQEQDLEILNEQFVSN